MHQNSVRDVITTNCAGGIQAERPYAGSYEFKPRGRPWLSVGYEGIMMRRLVNGILEAIFNTAWVLSIDALLGGRQRVVDTMLFPFQGMTPAPATGCASYSRVATASSWWTRPRRPSTD
ncbi:hypothetical protein DL767_002436 [Monosporascus sp. MG133]|nr:hypothetical protein DL767_002436 [Monosporascus sp. MG133]